MADAGQRIVAVMRLSGGETEVDLSLCRIFRTERAWSKREALGRPELRAPLYRCVYRLAPDGWWFQERDVSPPADSGLPHNGPIFTYAEVHPVSIAHKFIIDRQPMPPELAECIPQATEPAYFEWLKAHADEISRARTSPKAPADLSPSVGASRPPGGDRSAAGPNAQQKRTRRPRRLSKVQKAIVILKYRVQRARESIRVEDIAADADCSAQNLYKSPEFKKEWESARARRIKGGWKIEGVADCQDDSTLDIG